MHNAIAGSLKHATILLGDYKPTLESAFRKGER